MDQNDRRGEETESTRGLEGDSGRYPTLGLRGLLREEVRPHERFAIIGGFGLFLLEIAAIIYPGLIHPVFPTGALLFFLYPFSRGIVTRRLMQLSITVLCLWLFLSLAGVLFPFITAFVFAYLAAPPGDPSGDEGDSQVADLSCGDAPDRRRLYHRRVRPDPGICCPVRPADNHGPGNLRRGRSDIRPGADEPLPRGW